MTCEASLSCQSIAFIIIPNKTNEKFHLKIIILLIQQIEMFTKISVSFK